MVATAPPPPYSPPQARALARYSREGVRPLGDILLSVVTGTVATSLGVASQVLVDIFWWLWG